MTTANADQHDAWNGESGQRWVASADRHDTVPAPIAEVVEYLADSGPDRAILDTIPAGRQDDAALSGA